MQNVFSQNDSDSQKKKKEIIANHFHGFTYSRSKGHLILLFKFRITPSLSSQNSFIQWQWCYYLRIQLSQYKVLKLLLPLFFPGHDPQKYRILPPSNRNLDKKYISVNQKLYVQKL